MTGRVRAATGAIAVRPRQDREAQRRRLDEILAELREAVTKTVVSPPGAQHGEAQR
jgi:hypothetical protein